MFLQKFCDKFKPADFIGLAVICGGFYLLLHGIDTVVGGCVIAVVAYYFARVRRDDNTKIDKP